jgi:hypothetical protein
MKSQLRFIVDKNFKGLQERLVEKTKGRKIAYVGHELFACHTYLLRQCGREHHHLLVMGCCAEDLLDVTAHV